MIKEMSALEQRVAALAAPLLGEGIELVDVEFVKEHEQYLRIFIDKDGGIDLDDCQAASERIEAELDRADFVPGSYILEVSSPGLGRPLRRERDFAREAGKKVDISLYEPLDGKKSLTAELKGLSEDKKSVDFADRPPIECAKIAQIRLHIDF